MRQLVIDFDPYGVLGVAATASPEEVRAAWKAGVKRYHPDTAPPGLVADYTERTRRLNVAREVLLTPGWHPCPPPPVPGPPGPPPGSPCSVPASPAPVVPQVPRTRPREYAARALHLVVQAAVWAVGLLVAWCVLSLVLGILAVVVEMVAR